MQLIQQVVKDMQKHKQMSIYDNKFRLRMQEGSNINKSLTFLGMVIENLASN